jgi:hypothetical protein
LASNTAGNDEEGTETGLSESTELLSYSCHCVP